MNKSPLSKEDRDNLKKFLLDNTLADSPDKIKTLCINLGIFEIARRRNLTNKGEYDFVTDLVKWLHDTYNQKALNKLCEEIKPYCTNETLLNILLNIQTKIALPTIDIEEARSKLLEQVISYWQGENNKQEFKIKFKEKNGNESSTNTIYDFFNDNQNNNNKFLILGASGSGKSTMLRELNHELIKHKNEIPILLKLDSLHKNQTIDNWISESIKKVYEVDEETINTISGKYNEIGIIFLLDGFYEIEPSQQNQRAVDLNSFIEKHQCQTVITSQTEKKDLLLKELRNNSIFVELQPLEQEQIDRYIIDIMNKLLAELQYAERIEKIRPQTWKALTNNNPDILDLLGKPLGLKIAVHNFKNVPDRSNNDKLPNPAEIIQQLIKAEDGVVVPIPDEYISTLHDNLWQDYFHDQSEKLNNKNTTFSRDKIVWLAQQLNNTESTLSIENMQPKLLSEKNKEKILYYILVGLIVGILCGLSTGILSEILNYNSDNPQSYLNTINYIFFGLISGSISGLIGGIISWLKLNTKSWLKLNTDTQSKVRSAIIGFVSTIIRWLISNSQADNIQILDMIVFGIVFALIFYFLDLPEDKIDSVSHQEWSFDNQKAIKSVMYGMGWAAFSGLCMWSTLLINSIFDPLAMKKLNNPWLNNFITIVINIDNIDIQKDDILESLIGLLLFFIINYFLFREISRANNQNTQEDKNYAILRKYMYFGLFIFGIISIFIFHFIFNKIEQFYKIETFDKFYDKMNTFYWGTLTLELFVGLNIGLLLGFKKTDNTSNTSNQSQNNFIKKIRGNVIQKLKSAKLIKDRNNSILKTFVDLVVISLIIGFLSSIISWIFWECFSRYPKFVWWIFYRQNQKYGGILFGICVGLMISLLSGLVNGEKSGLVCIKYFALRLFLWMSKHIPWNYGQFLEEAVKVDLLKKEGGSYEFRHGELRKYIAEKYSSETQQ
ncbi:NACHT domain-containing protein [Dolichospermum circinale]|uniref:NACHT domain-containing protein n=3 Tax=Dolichospermum circinale TaxID=109265 RepID=UPI002330CEC1|nr:NACHT domain-containing protein [Dolichospermum circinale]MDB9474375.1 NACHT domain-containing protein [Dolichospermum circinale CS-537/11]MDB9478742.1 NACHT domain-containing protein [Dolichospermum circinale CS-537/03]